MHLPRWMGAGPMLGWADHDVVLAMVMMAAAAFSETVLSTAAAASVRPISGPAGCHCQLGRAPVGPCLAWPAGAPFTFQLLLSAQSTEGGRLPLLRDPPAVGLVSPLLPASADSL